VVGAYQEWFPQEVLPKFAYKGNYGQEFFSCDIVVTLVFGVQLTGVLNLRKDGSYCVVRGVTVKNESALVGG